MENTKKIYEKPELKEVELSYSVISPNPVHYKNAAFTSNAAAKVGVIGGIEQILAYPFQLYTRNDT